MSAKRPALGRGLDTLLAPPKPVPVDSGGKGSLRQVPIDQIVANPFQPRSTFDPEKIKELAESIRQKGILQPVLLRPKAAGGFELVAGERRWRAAQQAGLREIPAVLRDLDDREMLEAAVIENVQRDDLNPVEEARSYQRLTTEFGLTQDELARSIGRSRVAITNALRLLKLPTDVLKMLEHQELSAGHGRALLGLENPAAQLALAREAARKSLSVREVEAHVRRLQKERQEPKSRGDAASLAADATEWQERLGGHLGLKVRIQARTAASGRIELFYQSLDEFQSLCSRLGLETEKSL
jgi:ParB family chromosome partitioning protein